VPARLDPGSKADVSFVSTVVATVFPGKFPVLTGYEPLNP
jgi:hypothetical protein